MIAATPAWREWLGDDAHRRWDQLRMSRGLDLTCAAANHECARIGGACFFAFVALGELGSTMSADEWPVLAFPLLESRAINYPGVL